MTDPLSRLAILHGTDKFGYHDYTPNYFGLFRDLRDQPLRFLEIGVGGFGHTDRGGESLATWRDFFPNAQITGIDIQPKNLDFGPRVSIHMGSQVDAEFLAEVLAERGPFDVILDDGSHMNTHIVDSFDILFPDLVPGGIYVIEDVQTSFFKRYGGFLDLRAPNAVGLVAGQACDLVNASSAADISAIERFHNILVLHKSPAEGAPASLRDDRRIVDAAQRGAQVMFHAADVLADAALLQRLVTDAAFGDVIVIEGEIPDTSLLHEVFVQIDHREIAKEYPNTPIHDMVRRILSLAIYPGGVLIEVGDNDYPSNFLFDMKHPRVADAFAQMTEVIQDPAASETGLLQFAQLRRKAGFRDDPVEVLDRLHAMGCTDRRYFGMASAHFQHKRRWQELLDLCDRVGPHYPDAPEIIVSRANALQMAKRDDEALEVLRQALPSGRDSRAIVAALAVAEERAGHIGRAIELHHQSLALTPPSLMARRMEQFLRLCKTGGDVDRAVSVAEDLLKLDPDNATAKAMLSEKA